VPYVEFHGGGQSSTPCTRRITVSKTDDEKLAALVRKNAAKAAKPKAKRRRTYDATLQPETDADTERRDFFSEMKKRDFCHERSVRVARLSLRTGTERSSLDPVLHGHPRGRITLAHSRGGCHGGRG